MQKTADFLKKIEVYYIATIDGTQARVRPFGTANIFEGKLYFQTGKSKDVAKQLNENPKIEISGFDGTNWLRLTAKAVYDDRREARVDMLDNYPQLKSMYDVDDGETAVYYLEDATSTFYSFTDPPVVTKF
jgi:uncharacterized pyridoxamine 5'-phosphate oxidase family protein